MSVQFKTCVEILCDHCGKTWESGGDYVMHFSTEQAAERAFIDDDGEKDESGKHRCYHCVRAVVEAGT